MITHSQIGIIIVIQSQILLGDVGRKVTGIRIIVALLINLMPLFTSATRRIITNHNINKINANNIMMGECDITWDMRSKMRPRVEYGPDTRLVEECAKTRSRPSPAGVIDPATSEKTQGWRVDGTCSSHMRTVMQTTDQIYCNPPTPPALQLHTN